MASYDYIDATGVIIGDTGDIQATVEAEFKASFGDDLIVTADTPQGVLITAEVLARDAVIRNNAAVANQINPNMAGGIFLDAIWQLTGGQRVRATPSIVTPVTVTGVPGATLPIGSIASVGDGGPQFETTGTVEFAADGTAQVTFQSLDLGPVAAPPTELNWIVTGVLGWETVSNPNVGVLGLADESDTAGRARRRNTLALQGTALAEAVRSRLYATAGVLSALVLENYTGAPITVLGVTIPAHSLYCCVDGGLDTDVAAAIKGKKSLGCGFSGTTTINIADPYSGQVFPVKFDRPTLVPIYIIASVTAGGAVVDPTGATKTAMTDYASGLVEGEPGFVVGADVSAFELGGAVNIETVGLIVTNVLIGTAPAPTTSTPVAIAANEKATLAEGNITVNVA